MLMTESYAPSNSNAAANASASAMLDSDDTFSERVRGLIDCNTARVDMDVCLTDMGVFAINS